MPNIVTMSYSFLTILVSNTSVILFQCRNHFQVQILEAIIFFLMKSILKKNYFKMKKIEKEFGVILVWKFKIFQWEQATQAAVRFWSYKTRILMLAEHRTSEIFLFKNLCIQCFSPYKKSLKEIYIFNAFKQFVVVC